MRRDGHEVTVAALTVVNLERRYLRSSAIPIRQAEFASHR
jgi:hypothetical protein